MSKDFEYDPETGSFRFDEGDGKTKKKNDVDVGGWILIAALFAFGLWPIGLIALISKLSDKPKKVNSSRGGTRTSTSPNANVSSHSKVEKSVVKTAKQMNRAPKTSDKTARTLMIIGGIIAAIAGVIAMEPKVLILDEPTAGLDPRGREAILAQLRSYHKQKGNTVILVSHSMEEIARNVDRIVVMSHSHKLMDGTPEEVFSRADELLQVGLDVPQVTKVAMELQKRGLLADSSVYTIDELVRRLLALKGGEAAC